MAAEAVALVSLSGVHHVQVNTSLTVHSHSCKEGIRSLALQMNTPHLGVVTGGSKWGNQDWNQVCLPAKPDSSLKYPRKVQVRESGWVRMHMQECAEVQQKQKLDDVTSEDLQVRYLLPTPGHIFHSSLLLPQTSAIAYLGRNSNQASLDPNDASTLPHVQAHRERAPGYRKGFSSSSPFAHLWPSPPSCEN